MSIFINDLEENVHGQILKFADDTKIIRRIKDNIWILINRYNCSLILLCPDVAWEHESTYHGSLFET